MRIFKWKLILEFYATVGIPFLYLLNLLITNRYQATIQTPQALIIIGILISIIGLILWALSYINLGNSFGVLPRKTKRVKKGLYKYFKHPMYLAIWMTFFGLGLATGSLQGLMFLNLILLPVLIVRAKFEEKLLFD